MREDFYAYRRLRLLSPVSRPSDPGAVGNRPEQSESPNYVHRRLDTMVSTLERIMPM